MTIVSRLARNLTRPAKRAIAISTDIVLCTATVALAYWLRLSEWSMPFGSRWLSYFVAIGLMLVVFALTGQYRVIFRYTNSATLVSLARATLIYGAIYALVFTVVQIPDVPRTIGVLQPLLLLIFTATARSLGGTLLNKNGPVLRRGAARRAIVFGAGSAGRQLEAALERTSEMVVVAFADDNRTLHGAFLHGKPVHNSDDLAGLVERYGATDFLVAVPSATRTRRREIIESVAGTNAKIRILPGVVDIANGKVTVNELREARIDDLLGRDMVFPDTSLMSRNISGKVVMVTGAGGSIGSELCRQIMKQRPERLVLMELSEFNLYAIEEELLASGEDSTEIVPLIGSVVNRARVDQILERWKPHTIYHAAAYKHVPVVEDNPCEGLMNNTIGTMVMRQSAERHGVENFVFISTDKAVRPTNVMGATKRLAEQVVQAHAAKSNATRYSIVRFGNVLGSSGSVVPRFRAQIRAGGPVTVTHPEMTRYFMTIPEAAQLVIQAGAMAAGGEVFVLDMGEPVRIIDLARRMIELSGLSERTEARPDGDIEIVICGLRPGEKLYEELLIGNNPEKTRHPLIMKAHEHFIAMSELEPELCTARELAVMSDDAGVCGLLRRLVPEYRPAPPVKEREKVARSKAA
jgi:FlaA1/EpsC-like NDP-sugar epimerase